MIGMIAGVQIAAAHAAQDRLNDHMPVARLRLGNVRDPHLALFEKRCLHDPFLPSIQRDVFIIGNHDFGRASVTEHRRRTGRDDVKVHGHVDTAG